MAEVIIDRKQSDKAFKVERARVILDTLSQQSAYAKTLLNRITSKGDLLPSQWKKFSQPGGLEESYLNSFGEPQIDVVPVPIGGLQDISQVVLPVIQRPKAPEAPEDLLNIGKYEEETTPTRRALAWAFEHGETLIPTSIISETAFPFPLFNPIQSSALRSMEKDCNLVVSAPTSAGKTEVAICYALDAIKRGYKAIYLSPLKALSQEKYDKWLRNDFVFADYKVVIQTGDYQMTEAKKKELLEADLIILTTESLDAKSRNQFNTDGFLNRVGVVLVDEGHLLGAKDRGSRCEAALIRFSEMSPHAKIVLLSATMPNVDELKVWLTLLNGKETDVIASTFRPTHLDVWTRTYSDSNSYSEESMAKYKKALNIVQEFENDQFIIFCHTKGHVRGMSELLQKNHIRFGTHTADLSKEKRLASERGFKDGSIRVLVATSTLAMGLNLPARRVIILGIHRGMSVVPLTEIQQEVGRAGRAGIDPKGDAYILVPLSNANLPSSHFLTPQIVNSQFGDEDALQFQLIAEIRNGKDTLPQLFQWYRRSLFRIQHGEDDLEERLIGSLERLVKMDCIADEEPFRVLKLGHIAATNYFPPADCYAWKKNLQRAQSMDLGDDRTLAWCVANIPSYFCDYIPKQLAQVGESWGKRFSWEYNSFPMGYVIKEVLQGRQKSLAMMGLQGHWLSIANDIPRICSTLDRIQTQCVYTKEVDMEELTIRLSKGVVKNLVPLARIKGVGSKFASELYRAGFQTPQDILNNKNYVIDLIGKRGHSIIENAYRVVNGREEDGYDVFGAEEENG